MNNFPFPIPPINNNNYFFNIIDKINNIKKRLDILEQKINYPDKHEEKNYLKKDDNYHVI